MISSKYPKGKTHKRNILSISYAVSFAFAALSANVQATISATGGQQLSLPNSTYPDTMYNVTSGSGLYISGNGSQITGSGLTISTSASNALATVNNGGRLVLTDSTLKNTAYSTILDISGMGSYAELNGTSSIIASGTSGVAKVSGGASILLNGSTITTGNGTAFFWSTGSGSTLTANNATITSSGGTMQIDNNGKMEFNNSNISMVNGGSGISMTGGSLKMDGTHFETEGTAAAINQGYASTSEISNSSIITHGNYGTALFLPSNQSRAALTNTSLETFGERAIPVDARMGAQATLDGGSITTHGNNAHGLYASQDSGTGPTKITAKNLDINIYGMAYGVVSRMNGADVELDNVHITSSADLAAALFVSGTGAILNVQNSDAHTNGASAYGIDISNRANLTVNNSQLYTSGQGAAALYIRMTSAGDYTNVIPVTNSVLDTQNAPAIAVRGGGLNLTLNHSTVTGRSAGGDGVAISAGDYPYNGSTIALNNVTITATNSTLTGDVNSTTTNPASVFSLALQNASSLTGAVNASNGTLTLDATSQWDVRGDSTLNTLTNSGTMNFMAPVGGAFKTVTVNGNYTGNNALLVMSAALSDDSSPADKLVVNGDTAGNTNVIINNVGGTGGLTGNGIEMIQVGGNSAGSFTQQGRVIANGYEYTLYQGSLSQPSDGNWYLRSVALPTPPTPDPDPDPASDPAPWVSPVVGAYLGNQSAAVNMFTQTLHDRLGEPQFTESNRSNLAPSVWLRVTGNRADSKAAGQELSLSTDTTVVQLGGDLARWSSNGHDRWHLGVMAGYGHSKTDSTHDEDYGKDALRNASGSVDGYSVGAYATWYGNAEAATGPYVDTWLQYGWYSNDVSASGTKTDSYDSRNLSASVEAGYAFKLSDSGTRQWMVEPQAQLVYNSYDADSHTTDYGEQIHSPDADGVTTRLGARLYSRQTLGGGVQPFVEVNWLHGSADNSLSFGSSEFNQDLPKDRYEVKAGVQAQLAKNWNLWGHVGYQAGNNDYSRLEGLAGVKYTW